MPRLRSACSGFTPTNAAPIRAAHSAKRRRSPVSPTPQFRCAAQRVQVRREPHRALALQDRLGRRAPLGHDDEPLLRLDASTPRLEPLGAARGIRATVALERDRESSAGAPGRATLLSDNPAALVRELGVPLHARRPASGKRERNRRRSVRRHAHRWNDVALPRGAERAERSLRRGLTRRVEPHRGEQRLTRAVARDARSAPSGRCRLRGFPRDPRVRAARYATAASSGAITSAPSGGKCRATDWAYP